MALKVLNILQRQARERKILWVWDHDGNNEKN